MLVAYVTKSMKSGDVLSVNMTIYGAAMNAFGHGDASLDGGRTEYSVTEIERRLEEQPFVLVDYGDGEQISIERHGVRA